MKQHYYIFRNRIDMGPFVFLVLVLISRSGSAEISDSKPCNCSINEVEQRMAELKHTVSDLTQVLNSVLPMDCREVLAAGNNNSGVYTIQPVYLPGEPFQVYCDMETDGGGWTVFQRRKDGSVDFYLDFANYTRGFGNLEGEFWLGNDNLRRLTYQTASTLRVDLTAMDGETRFAFYRFFKIFGSKENFKLSLSAYSGNAGDSLTEHLFQEFSTKDNDNDLNRVNCAQAYHGAWWYKGCHHSNLNGLYLNGPTDQIAKGVVWKTWKGYGYSLKGSEMKMRPLDPRYY